MIRPATRARIREWWHVPGHETEPNQSTLARWVRRGLGADRGLVRSVLAQAVDEGELVRIETPNREVRYRPHPAKTSPLSCAAFPEIENLFHRSLPWAAADGALWRFGEPKYATPECVSLPTSPGHFAEFAWLRTIQNAIHWAPVESRVDECTGVLREIAVASLPDAWWLVAHARRDPEAPSGRKAAGLDNSKWFQDRVRQWAAWCEQPIENHVPSAPPPKQWRASRQHLERVCGHHVDPKSAAPSSDAGRQAGMERAVHWAIDEIIKIRLWEVLGYPYRLPCLRRPRGPIPSSTASDGRLPYRGRTTVRAEPTADAVAASVLHGGLLPHGDLGTTGLHMLHATALHHLIHDVPGLVARPFDAAGAHARHLDVPGVAPWPG